MDVMKALLGLQDYRIRFTTGEGDYEGTISIITPEIELLVISKLIWLPKNTKLGTLTFRAHEIKAFKIIGLPEVPKPNSTPTYHNPSRYYRDTKRHTLIDEDYDESISANESEMYGMYRDDEIEYDLKLPPSFLNVLPIDNVIIDQLNQNFHDAIRHIKMQDAIGVSLESPKIGRHEELHWLCISTASCTFLFDIQHLNLSCFTTGLKDILENSSIEKVIHDCRETSDCLFHQFDTRIVNVFDTQVADYIINQQRKRSDGITTQVNPLNSCLAQHLNVPDEYLHRRKPRSYQDDLVFYGLRPISNDFRDLFIKNVIYLLQLKQELDVILVEPVGKGMEIYLQSLQKKTDREFELESLNPDIVPDELLLDEIQIFRFRKHVNIPAVVSSGPPYRPIANSFQNYLEYCDKFEIGEFEQRFKVKRKVKELTIKPSRSHQFICRKRHCDGTCVAFINDRMYFCRREKEANSSVSSSNDLEGLKTICNVNYEEHSIRSSSDFDDNLKMLREAFTETSPTNEGRKLVFVPAGMDNR